MRVSTSTHCDAYGPACRTQNARHTCGCAHMTADFGISEDRYCNNAPQSLVLLGHVCGSQGVKPQVAHNGHGHNRGAEPTISHRTRYDQSFLVARRAVVPLQICCCAHVTLIRAPAHPACAPFGSLASFPSLSLRSLHGLDIELASDKLALSLLTLVRCVLFVVELVVLDIPFFQDP